jgi:hypothetical protein
MRNFDFALDFNAELIEGGRWEVLSSGLKYVLSDMHSSGFLIRDVADVSVSFEEDRFVLGIKLEDKNEENT